MEAAPFKPRGPPCVFRGVDVGGFLPGLAMLWSGV